MKNIGAGLRRIFKEDKIVLVLMLVLFAFGVILAIHTFVRFKAGGTTMYIGYSDIGSFSNGEWGSLWSSGGYKTGGWSEMAVFPILGFCLGVLHNLFAIQVYKRRGRGYAIAVVIFSLLIAIGAFVLLMRLLGEI